MAVTGVAGIGKSRLGVGVLQVRRRSRGRRLLAPGTLPRLRRGRRVLGTRGDGPRTRGHRGGARHRRRPPRSSPTRSRDSSADTEERRWIEPRLASPARPRGSGRLRRARTCSRPGDGSSSASPQTRPGRARLRRPPVGGSGLLDFIDHLLDWSRTISRYSSLRLARPGARSSAGPAGERGGVASTSLFLEPLDDGDDGVAPARDGARPPRARRARDPRSRGGDPALRRRDRQDAPRSRAASP